MATANLLVEEPNRDRLSESFLDSCRGEADPAADNLIESLYREGALASARTLVATLVKGGEPPSGRVSAAWNEFAAGEELEPVDSALLRRAEEVFRVWGPQITLGLCFGSLGGGYAANRIAHLLLGVSRLESDPSRRVFETAQLLFDVLGPRGLEPGGSGIESAERVRLMHAGVRRLLRDFHQSDPGEDWVSPMGDVFWRDSWGVPINQEDMMGTILTMSVHVLECLKTLGVRLSVEDRWAYVYAWLRVARIMGVKEDLVPRDLREARHLWAITQRRQFAASVAGAELERALLDAMDELLPARGLRFISRALVWRMNGPEVAKMVGLAPLTRRERLGFHVWLAFDRGLSRLEARSRFVRNRVGSAGTVMVKRLDGRELGGQRPPFGIPESLAGEWALRTVRKPAQQ